MWIERRLRDPHLGEALRAELEAMRRKALAGRLSSREFEEGWPRCDALLRLEPHTARWMKTWRVASIVEAAEAGDPDGWVRLRVTFDHPSEACFVVLGLGPRADVIEPASLRERVAAEAAAVVARGRQG